MKRCLCVALVCVVGAAGGCAHIPPGTLDTIITTMAPIVIDMIVASRETHTEQDEVRVTLEAECHRDLARVSTAALHLLSRFRAAERELVPANIRERILSWQIAYEETALWYEELYDETPEVLVRRLYACAGGVIPENPGWEFFTTIVFRHLGYDVTADDIAKGSFTP